MTVNLDVNEDYENWLKSNDYHESLLSGMYEGITRIDCTPIWTDNTGRKFVGLCNQKIFENGWNCALNKISKKLKELNYINYTSDELVKIIERLQI